jgi:hypothetical protein
VTTRRNGIGVALVLLAAWACTDAVPTSEDPGLSPVDAETFEVVLPFELFGRDFRTFSGFRTQGDLGAPTLAHEWTPEGADPEEGVLEARPLLRFGVLPDTVLARAPGEETATADTDFTPVSGALTIFFDTVGVDEALSVTVTAAATESSWDRISAGWDMAVDTLGDRRTWPEPGGGPVRVLETLTWNRSEMDGDTLVFGDSLVFEVDSLTATEWVDGTLDHRGVRLSAETENVRLRIRDASLRVRVRPSINPDTLVQMVPRTRESTFIYSPAPSGSTEAFLVGGAPASRATLRIDLPEVLDGDGEICDFIPCPLELLPEQVLFASLILRTAATTPVPLQPRDSVRIDVRPVLSPERLPRSPMGASLLTAPVRLQASRFGPDAGEEVEIPMTRYIQGVVQGIRVPEEGAPTTLAILTPSEPQALEPATFQGPGTPGEPRLRLIITRSPGVSLP